MILFVLFWTLVFGLLTTATTISFINRGLDLIPDIKRYLSKMTSLVSEENSKPINQSLAYISFVEAATFKYKDLALLWLGLFSIFLACSPDTVIKQTFLLFGLLGLLLIGSNAYFLKSFISKYLEAVICPKEIDTLLTVQKHNPFKLIVDERLLYNQLYVKRIFNVFTDCQWEEIVRAIEVRSPIVDDLDNNAYYALVVVKTQNNFYLYSLESPLPIAFNENESVNRFVDVYKEYLNDFLPSDSQIDYDSKIEFVVQCMVGRNKMVTVKSLDIQRYLLNTKTNTSSKTDYSIFVLGDGSVAFNDLNTVVLN